MIKHGFEGNGSSCPSSDRTSPAPVRAHVLRVSDPHGQDLHRQGVPGQPQTVDTTTKSHN